MHCALPELNPRAVIHSDECINVFVYIIIIVHTLTVPKLTLTVARRGDIGESIGLSVYCPAKA